MSASREVLAATDEAQQLDAETSAHEEVGGSVDASSGARSTSTSGVVSDALAAPPAHHPYHEPLPALPELAKGPAMRIANLLPGACSALLRKNQLPFRFTGPQNGIATPVRFTGSFGELEFRVPPEKSPYGFLDCRLALLLAEIAPLLREHQVHSLRIDNFYRPGARLPARRAKKSQHAYGLAADVVSFTLDDGTVLDVERDFHGRLGEPVCGPSAYLEPPADVAVRLRNLTCALARSGAFHHILTPHHDLAHRNHLHLDIKRDNQWFSIQ